MPPAPAPGPVTSVHPLTGRGTGTYQVTRTNPDVGMEFKAQGTAQMVALGGTVAVAADLHTPGNIANGVTTGTLVVSTKAGSVTVALTSFRPAVDAGAPIWYRYRVTAGTGTFAGMHDTGSLRLDWVPAIVPGPPILVGPGSPATPTTGTGTTTPASGQSTATASGTTTNPGTPPATPPAGTTTGATGTATGSPAALTTMVSRGTFRLTV